MSTEQVWGKPLAVGPVKIAFPYLHKIDEGHRYSKGKYKLTMLVPKSDTEMMKELTQAIKDTGEVSKLSDLEKHPLIDGPASEGGQLKDGDSPEMVEFPEYKGCIYFDVTTKRRPECFVVGEDGNPKEVIDPREIEQQFYAGCECIVSLQPHKYDEGSVTLYLQGVMKTGDGTRFGGGVRPEQQFLKVLAKKGGLKATAKVIEEASDSEQEEVEAAPAKKGRPPKKKANGVDAEEVENSLAKGGKKKKKTSEASDLSAVLD